MHASFVFDKSWNFSLTCRNRYPLWIRNFSGVILPCYLVCCLEIRVFNCWLENPTMKQIRHQGVKKRRRLSWLTKSAFVYEPKCWGGGGGVRGLSQWVQLYTWSPNKLWRSNSIFDLWKTRTWGASGAQWLPRREGSAGTQSHPGCSGSPTIEVQCYPKFYKTQ